MANLLPTSERKVIRKEYRARLGVVSSSLVLGLIIISIVLLIPSFILSSYKYISASDQLEVEKKKISDAVEGVDPIKAAKEVNAKLVVLEQKDSPMPLAYDIFVNIVGHKPENVGIDAIFYDRDFEDGRISITGVSKDRKTLLSFLQSLEGEEMFSSVELPISSFVEGEDIDFTIRIIIEMGDESKEGSNNEENEEE